MFMNSGCIRRFFLFFSNIMNTFYFALFKKKNNFIFLNVLQYNVSSHYILIRINATIFQRIIFLLDDY